MSGDPRRASTGGPKQHFAPQPVRGSLNHSGQVGIRPFYGAPRVGADPTQGDTEDMGGLLNDVPMPALPPGVGATRQQPPATAARPPARPQGASFAPKPPAGRPPPGSTYIVQPQLPHVPQLGSQPQSPGLPVITSPASTGGFLPPPGRPARRHPNPVLNWWYSSNYIRRALVVLLVVVVVLALVLGVGLSVNGDSSNPVASGGGYVAPLATLWTLWCSLSTLMFELPSLPLPFHLFCPPSFQSWRWRRRRRRVAARWRWRPWRHR